MKEKPAYISEDVMKKWNEDWSDPKFITKAEQYKKNRLSQTQSNGSGISTHTGGSISHHEHSKKLVSMMP